MQIDLNTPYSLVDAVNYFWSNPDDACMQTRHNNPLNKTQTCVSDRSLWWVVDAKV